MEAPLGAPLRLKVRVWAGRSTSLAVAVKVRLLVAVTDWLGMISRTGALLGGALTVIEIVRLSERAGEPSSVTRTVTGKVPVWARVGVQENAPVPGLMEAPLGAPASKLKLRVWAGMSTSVAVAVKVNSVVAVTVRLAREPRDGALLGGGVTVIEMVWLSESVGDPLSVTRTVTEKVPTWVRVGVQEKRPLLELIEAPLGAPLPRLKVRFWAGTSTSLAVAVKVRLLVAAMVWLASVSRDGAVLGGRLTVIERFRLEERAGEPSSVTRTVTE